MNEHIFELIEERIPRKSPHKVRQDGEYFLALCKCSGSITSLNYVAGEILNRCSGDKKVKEIVSEISDIFPSISIERIRYDVAHCISDLEKMGFISVVNQDASCS